MEIVSRIISIELTTMKNVSIITDNAGNYNSNLIPVVAIFNFRKYGIHLSNLVHSETQEGKGPADLHFATATRFADRYIETNALNVVTPDYLVHALNHGERTVAGKAELLGMDYSSDQYKEWKKGEKGLRNAYDLRILGRCNEIRYTKKASTDAHIIAETFTYKYKSPFKWKSANGSSLCLDSKLRQKAAIVVEGGGKDGEEDTEIVHGDVINIDECDLKVHGDDRHDSMGTTAVKKE